MAVVVPRARQLLAWGVWLALLVADVTYVLVYGDEVPFWDDWAFVPELTGGRPVTLSWLWSPHNEHRIPVPRLLYLGLVRLAGGDLRAPLIANVILLAAAAAVLLVTMRRLRERAAYADALIPLVLMHPGHGELLLWATGLAPCVWALFGSVAIACVAGGKTCSSWRAALLATSLLVLALSGAAALALVPPFVFWLLWTMKDASTRARVAFGIPATLAVVAWTGSLVELVRPPIHPRAPGVSAALGTAFEFLAMGFGPAGRAAWPISGLVASIAVGGAAVALAHALATRPDERMRALGLLAALGAFVSLALVVGWGRSGFGAGAGLATRYALLAAPALLCAYVVALLYLSPAWAMVAHASLFALTCAALPYDVKVGVDGGRLRRAHGRALRADVDAGLSVHDIATRHAGSVYPEPVTLEQGLAMLRTVRLGPFRTSAVPGRRYPMFATAPDDVRSSVGVEPETAYGEEGLMVHAPGDMRFHLSPGSHVLAVRFGVRPEAHTSGQTDGVEFEGALVTADGEHVLFQRFLDPLHAPLDRRLQSVRVDVAAPRGGDLVLRTLPGPANDLRWDWSVWTAVELQASGG